MKTPVKILFSGLLLLTLALTSGFISTPHKTGKSSPQYEGILSLPGLNDSVTVYRDERGMPHIYAANEHDLYMATGYIAAQERLWQMDLIRRSAAGRLSEIFGKSFMQADVFTRCLQIYETSRRILKDEDPEIIACMQAYTDGVNAFISSAGKRLPLEYRLLSYKPEPWCNEDIVSIIGLMGWNLDYRNLTAELFIQQLINKLGIEKTIELIPDWQAAENIVYPDFKLNNTLVSLTRSFVSSYNKVTELGIPSLTASNNWAVSGERSETGRPLLSNDMHLSLTSPGIWMQIHQVIPGKLNVTGVMIPGEPLIIAGHNEKIAWGLTNLRVDAVDLFTETINPENSNQYLFNSEWREFTNKTEIIKEKGGKHDTVNIRFTHRGPVISGFIDLDKISSKVKWLGFNYLKGLRDLEDLALSMRWTGFDKSDEVRSVYLLNIAGGWDDFREGLKTFRSISQNFAYADTDGNIGMNTGGGIPVRGSHGILIRDGTTDLYDWKGYVPFEQLPFSLNPESGSVSSANNRTVSNDYPYFVSHSFELPYRINRIREMLNEKMIHGIEDFKTMLADRHSDYARLLVPFILKLNDRKNGLTTIELQALEAIRDWDYDMNLSLTAPTIFEFFRISFLKNLLADELGDLYDQLWDICGEYYIYRILTEGPDEWVDNVSTEEEETLDNIVMQSFKDAVRSLTKKYGKDPSGWMWGKIHTITFMHPLGSVRILGSLFKLNSAEYPIGGSDHTVCPYFTYNSDFKAVNGASMRYIYNTADWDDSYSVIPGGASGVPGSEFYLSQVQTYLEGKFYKDHFSDEAVREAAKYTLVLKPGD
jgi:penicillin amidase